MLRVAITGIGGGVGMAVLRSLKEYRVEMEIIGLDTAAYAPGLYYAKRGYLVPSAGDSRYRERVLDICKTERINVLIVGTDPELIPIASMNDELASLGCIPICASAEVIAICRDKFDCSTVLRNAGFPFVKTVRVEDIDALAGETGFPIIVKPLGGSASAGTRVIFRPSEMAETKKMTGYIAQEYLIPENWGKKKNQLTADDVYSHGSLIQRDEISIQVLTGFEGNFLGCFTSRNVLKNGVPMLIEPLREDTSGAEKTAKEIAAYLAKLGLKGPCNLQCKITTAGPVFFESNLRFTGITAVRTAMGFREVEACIRSMVVHDNADKIRSECLETDYGYICSRYITEYLFPVDKAPVAGGGRTYPNAQTADHSHLTPDVCSEGRGWSVHL